MDFDSLEAAQLPAAILILNWQFFNNTPPIVDLFFKQSQESQGGGTGSWWEIAIILTPLIYNICGNA